MKILTSIGTLVLIAALVVPFQLASADNIATQQASTNKAITIHVVDKDDDTAVATITFPQGNPGATISNPYNNVNGANDPQVLSTSASEPVVRLKNTATVSYNITLEITNWNATHHIVASEDYELVDINITNVSVVDDVLSSDGGAAIVATGVSIGADAYKALYLEVVLGTAAGKSGSSTLTILGETP